jgi:DnaJ-class molecular chaperone
MLPLSFSDANESQSAVFLTNEIKCEACDGTGVQIVKQPSDPMKRVYAPPCEVCGGKGRVKKVTD